MLSDLERKVLRILLNFSSQRHRMPTKPELECTTGRRYEDIKSALDVLVQQHYIFWPDNPRLDTIVILEGWERDTSMPKPKPTITSNLDYWTKY